MMTILIPALLGLLGGVVGSLVAPWVQWAVEKRRNILNYRLELIKSWREAIEAFNYHESEFGDTSTYSAIRPHLSPEMLEKLDKARTVYVGGGRGELVKKHMLLDEVARIEQKWELV